MGTGFVQGEGEGAVTVSTTFGLKEKKTVVEFCGGEGCRLKSIDRSRRTDMARYGALAGAAAAAAAAAIGVLCSYEARVLHFHSSPGDTFKVIAVFLL